MSIYTADITPGDNLHQNSKSQVLYRWWGLVLLGVLLRLFFLLAEPLYPSAGLLPGYNDEPLHLHYIRILSETNRWPVFHPEAEVSDSLSAEFVQPPLYYALAAPLWRWGESLHPGGGLFGARLLSLLGGIIAALFCYRMILLAKGNSVLAVSGGAVLLFAPTTVVFTSLVTNDALVMTFGTLFLYSIVCSQGVNSTPLRQALSGVYLAAGVWTKLSALALFPLLWFVAPQTASTKLQWLARLRAFLTAIALITPLLAWNAVHYGNVLVSGGRPLSEKYSSETVMNEPGNAADHPLKALKIMLRTAVQPFQEIWGSSVEKASSAVWLTICLAAFWVGLMVSIKHRMPNRIFLTALICLTGAFIFRGFLTFQVEFRLFMPVFATMATITANGLVKMRIPVGGQVMLWILPLVVMFLIRFL